MIAVSSTQRVTRKPDLVATGVDSDLVMLSIERGQYYSLSGVGTRVWELLAEPKTVDDLTRVICAEYAVEETTCKAEISEFINELIRMGLASSD